MDLEGLTVAGLLRAWAAFHGYRPAEAARRLGVTTQGWLYLVDDDLAYVPQKRTLRLILQRTGIDPKRLTAALVNNAAARIRREVEAVLEELEPEAAAV